MGKWLIEAKEWLRWPGWFTVLLSLALLVGMCWAADVMAGRQERMAPGLRNLSAAALLEEGR